MTAKKPVKKTKGKTYPPTPECDKLKIIQPDSQKIGAFLEWLSDQGLQICRLEDMSVDDMWIPDYVNIQKRLEKYFEIDMNKVEAEKRAILESIQK